jgi:predicted amidophosphoribosyltransferase
LLSLPVLVIFFFRWSTQRLLSRDNCPVCGFESEALEGSRFLCPRCQEPLFVADGYFYRHTPPGTIEVELLQE